MPGYVPPIPTDARGAPEVNFWLGDTQEPTLAERIAGHEAYPAPSPAYDVENYARNVQYQANLRVLAGALYAERGASIVTIAGVTVGNQRRLTINGTAVNYSDTGADTLTTVTQAFVDAINANVTITAGAGAAGAAFIAAGQLGIYAAQPGSNSLTVVAAVLAGAGTIVASAVTTPSIVVPPQLLGAVEAYVLGTSPDDDGPDNDVRLVLDRLTGAFRAGSVSATQWDTRAAGSIGIGIQAVPVADDAIAIGTGSDATAVADVAIGKNSAADSGGGGNDQATAIGTATATGEAATAVGFGAAATAATATATGASATASAANATAVGASATASSTTATAVGKSSTASGARSTALGDTTTASGTGDVAIGYSSIAAGDNSVAIGVGASATNAGVAIGEGANTTGSNGVALGELVRASGDGALATGHAETSLDVQASGDGSRAHGLGGTSIYGVNASAAGADAMGRGVTASGAYSRATGFGTTAGNRGEVAHASLGITDIAGPSVEAATHQAGKVIVQCRTAASTTRRMRTDAIDQTTGTTWTPMDDRGYYVKIKVIGKSETSAVAEVFTGEGIVAVDAGAVAVSIVGGLTLASLVALGGGFTTPSVVVAASGGGINIDATVGAGLAVRWTATIEYVQAGINY
jgi:trimeric autotransporter adhesin